MTRALLQQQGIRVTAQFTQRLAEGLDRSSTVSDSARQLLDGRIAVEFQRIEIGLDSPSRSWRDSILGLGLQFEVTQLAAQSVDGLPEFPEVEGEAVVLLLDAGAVDAHLAGIVDHLVQRLGRHPDALGARRRRCLLLR